MKLTPTYFFKHSINILKYISYKIELIKFPVLKNIFQLPVIDLKVPLPENLTLCNPSILSTENGWEVIIRIHNTTIDKFGRNWTVHGPNLINKIWKINFDNNFAIQSSFEVNPELTNISAQLVKSGFEDGRIFKHGHNIYILSTTCNLELKVNTMILGQLEGKIHKIIKYITANNLNPTEKNWMPVVTTDPETEMAVIYSLHPLKILNINTLEFIHSKEYPIINELEKFSGSSQLVQYEDGYLAVIHKRNYAKHGGKFYIHKFIKFSSDFKIKKISKSFFLEKRQSVEFCGGMAIKNHRLVLSFGSMDKKAKLLEMNLAQVEKLFSEK